MDSREPQDLLADLAKLKTLCNPQMDQNLRNYRRFIVRGDAELYDMDRSSTNLGPMPVLLRDLGRGGVGFISPKPLDVDTTWRICFLHRGYVIGQQGIVIRHCQQVQNDIYLVGSQFCITSGLMCLLGISPATIAEGDKLDKETEPPLYLAPGDVA